MSLPKLYPIVMQPGIKKDGTRFAGRNYIDGQWCRFYRGLPRKMGGYSQITTTVSVPRGIFVYPNGANFSIYIGEFDRLSLQAIDQFGNPVGAVVIRTPAGFVASLDNIWSFGLMFSTTENENLLLAHAPQNLSNISSIIESPIYFGNAYDNAPLTPTGITTSGGFVVLHPYLFVFGNNGEVRWSVANDPTNFPAENVARIASLKIIAGISTRGGNSSPAGILWSLDAIIRVTFTGGPGQFTFDTISNQSSILSSRSMVEYDSVIYWAATDRFMYYNGAPQELPNQMNLRYFFYGQDYIDDFGIEQHIAGLTYSERQKVWASKVTQWGEIWWFYPTADSVNGECDKAVIYNVREKCWYSTLVNRSAGYFEQVFADPIWADSSANGGGTYSIWQHEDGIDQVVGLVTTAIPSSFETGDIAFVAVGPSGQWTGDDKLIDLYRIEPDFIQDGNLTLTVRGRQYAASPNVDSAPFVFTPTTTKIDLREQRREMTLKFESNAMGGFYELGNTLLVIRVGDTRP